MTQRQQSNEKAEDDTEGKKLDPAACFKALAKRLLKVSPEELRVERLKHKSAKAHRRLKRG
jgi:hypothetical protein